ncbi:immune-associated nucleotide-binding protein 7 [Plakobranchus ocellatus]|uniref:Immune-associated nucleotide-binding protein 7 n=1 Tax=Plakobranchus ocellatus TaxID=259542 RepID=A0AAV4BEN0_9GAST|nr:immune-associated nucleotide-binding protein 7 [Plakobranchus ocellatus]
MASGQTVNLHLIGKQGSGKSATGNSIIKERTFRPRSTDSPAKATLPVTQGQHINFTLCVWDWPGTDGTQDKSKTIAKELRKMNQDLHHNIHLFGWVIRYGELCGQEDEEFLRFLISEHGEEFLRNRTIVIVTCKDNFDRDVEGTQLTFDEWKGQQKGFFENLRNMCNNRILSFDNRSRPLTQKNRLFNLIWTLTSNLPRGVTSYQFPGDRYTTSPVKQHSSKLLEVSDHHPLSSADDRWKSKPHTQLSVPKASKDDKIYLNNHCSDIDSLINILADTTLSKRKSALESLLLTIRSRRDREGEELRRALEREIEREIRECEFFNSQGKNTCMYLQKLKEKMYMRF